MECASKKEKVYRPRHPEKTPFYSVLFHYFDRFVGEYDLRFDKHYGKWRAVMAYVVAKYLDCGMLKNGFARIRCPCCREEYLLAFSCKGRGFCPSCSAKRSVLWGEFVRRKVLADCAHRHLVFSIPKMFRIFFLYNRKLLTELSRCAWKAIRQYFDVCSPEGTLPGGILSIATAVRLGGSTGILIFMHWFPQELSMQTDPLLPLSCLPKMFCGSCLKLTYTSSWFPKSSSAAI
ncbi:MAG TPA: transposase zinc-binding domain-containing protein [Acidobacteriota bacterium]|nr:transposase zinc-binding domain-containing protein [Acidobacteriota bacterium]